MKHLNTGKEQDKLINRLERQEKKQSIQRDRFLKYKLNEIHASLTQELLMQKVVESDDAGAFSELILKGLKKLLKISEFDYKFFIAPIRGLVPRPNPISLYMTQYILEDVMKDPCVVDVFGTEEDIYKTVNRVISSMNLKFERAEEKIMQQLSNSKSLIPGSREFDIALEEAFRKSMGDPKSGSIPQ
ncbi:MAG: DUF507 family protein [Deltaproteobacteria bacterium]|jgi:hypothetical protein|nr:DUF507 family protein [Deltaproteobacteria bacterium]